MSQQKAGSGEHPAVAAYHRTLKAVADNVDEAQSESARRLDEELARYLEGLEDVPRRRASRH